MSGAAVLPTFSSLLYQMHIECLLWAGPVLVVGCIALKHIQGLPVWLLPVELSGVGELRGGFGCVGV